MWQHATSYLTANDGIWRHMTAYLTVSNKNWAGPPHWETSIFVGSRQRHVTAYDGLWWHMTAYDEMTAYDGIWRPPVCGGIVSSNFDLDNRYNRLTLRHLFRAERMANDIFYEMSPKFQNDFSWTDIFILKPRISQERNQWFIVWTQQLHRNVREGCR